MVRELLLKLCLLLILPLLTEVSDILLLVSFRGRNTLGLGEGAFLLNLTLLIHCLPRNIIRYGNSNRFLGRGSSAALITLGFRGDSNLRPHMERVVSTSSTNTLISGSVFVITFRIQTLQLLKGLPQPCITLGCNSIINLFRCRYGATFIRESTMLQGLTISVLQYPVIPLSHINGLSYARGFAFMSATFALT